MSFAQKYYLNYAILLLPVVPVFIVFKDYMYLGNRQFGSLLVYFIFAGLMAFYLCFKSMRNLLIRKPYTYEDLFLGLFFLPFALNFITGCFLNFTRFIPCFFGSDKIIGIGAGQGVSNLSLYSIEDFIFNCFFVSFYEEILFKFVPLSLIILIAFIFLGLRHHKLTIFRNSKRTMLYLLNKIRSNKFNKVNVIFAILISIIFSLAHKPDYSNFHIYFFIGLINSLLFIKYGLASAIVGHMSYNYFSHAHLQVGAFIYGLFRYFL